MRRRKLCCRCRVREEVGKGLCVKVHREVQCRTKMDSETKMGQDGLLNKQDKQAEPLGKDKLPQSSHCTAE